MNQVSPKSLIKDILFEGTSTVADRLTEQRGAECMFDMTAVSLDALFSSALRGLCCSTAHGKR